MIFFQKTWETVALDFSKNFVVYWNHLSRFTNLLIILNISLFFLTELVTRQGYYFTFISLFFLGIIQIGLLIPCNCLHRLSYYMLFVACELIACYFLITSIWYWISTSRV